MKEGFPDADEEGQASADATPKPEVPVPDDFPDEVIVTRPPGLSIEEQRRAADADSDNGIKRHDRSTLSNPITRHR